MASSRSSSWMRPSTPSLAATSPRREPRLSSRHLASPSSPDSQPQSWYHWGELWLASAVITIFGDAPLAARYFVVLPVVLLAAAALTGTIVRRMARTYSRRAYLFGFLACLFLAPVPLICGSVLQLVGRRPDLPGHAVRLGRRRRSCSACIASPSSVPGARLGRLAAFVGSGVAFILPAHIVFAVARSRRGRERLGDPDRAVSESNAPPADRGAGLATHPHRDRHPVVTASAIWGLAHRPRPRRQRRDPTDGRAVQSVLGGVGGIIVLGAGVFLAIPLAWLLASEDRSLDGRSLPRDHGSPGRRRDRLGRATRRFHMFHFFFGGIAIFATPVAAVAVVDSVDALRAIASPAVGGRARLSCS